MTDYYVAPGGNNGWPGTEAQPWQTIGYAVQHIYADDTLWIRAGEYLSPSGGFQFANSGSSGHPVTVRNYPGESAIIRVNDQGIWYAPWVGNAEGSGPVVDHIHIIGSNIASRVLSCGISSVKGIVVQGPDATYTDAPGVRVWNAAYWEVAGLDFVRMGYGLFGHTYDNDHFYVHDCRVIDSTRENHVQFNGPYHTIENNVLVRDRPDYHSPYGCYSLALLAHGNVVRGNVIDNLQDLGVNPGGILLEWDISDENIIEGNIVRHMDLAMDFAGGDRNIIRNNVFITGDYSHIDGGLYIRSYDEPGPTWPCQNEWLVPPVGHPAYDMYYPHDCHSRDNQIYNNVFVGFNKAILFEGVVPDGETIIRNNAFVDCVDSVCTWSSCGSFSGVTQSNNREDPPFGFVDQGAEDFHLLETSPCKDAGYNLGSLVPDDFDGVLRPQGAGYDIGAFEYVPTSIPLSIWRRCPSSRLASADLSQKMGAGVSQAVANAFFEALSGGYYHGLSIQGVGEVALCDVSSHPLRIRKGGTTYGIELVSVGDGNASKVRIQTPTGIKALRKYT